MAEDSRYIRQTMLPQIGEKGQKKLAQSKVAVVGCGGLGAPVLTYLALAGVGNIRMIDDDTVNLTNLNRQFFYTESDIYQEKCKKTADFLQERNTKLTIEPLCERLTDKNVKRLLAGVDVSVDCVDRIETRKHVGRAACGFRIPFVEGGVHGFYGYVLPVLPGESACLECMAMGTIEEKPPIPALGAVAGVIGSLQAVECIKILLGLSHVMYGKMLQYDGLYGEFTEIPVHIRADCDCQKFNKIVNDESHMQ